MPKRQLSIWFAIASVYAVTIAWAMLIKMPIAWVPSQLLLPCTVVAAVFYFRTAKQFQFCLLSILQITIFASGCVFCTYLFATVSRPLIDAHLASVDASLGFNLPAWMASRTTFIKSINIWAYNSVFYQTAAIIVILSLYGDFSRVETFLLRFIAASIITLILFGLWPAAGPFEWYKFSPSGVQEKYLEHFYAMRAGVKSFNFTDVVGMITFPSFHTEWAVLVTAAVFHRRRLFYPFLVLNIFVIESTLSTGWHYLSDDLAGFGVCFLVCYFIRSETRTEVVAANEASNANTVELQQIKTPNMQGA